MKDLLKPKAGSTFALRVLASNFCILLQNMPKKRNMEALESASAEAGSDPVVL